MIQFIKLRIEGIEYMERQYQKIEEEMPIPDENIKQQSSRATVPNSKLNTFDYNNHK